MQPIELLTVTDVARLLHTKPKTISNRVSSAPWSLPPMLRIPGQRKPLWREEAVTDWLKRSEVMYEAP